MGDYRITVEAYGGHGCQREVGDGGTVYGCGKRGCPDCEARAFVATLERMGEQVKKATLEHWPAGIPVGPVDDLKTKVRKGSF